MFVFAQGDYESSNAPVTGDCLHAACRWVAKAPRGRAEVNQLAIGRATSVAYLPIMVMEDRKLMEKYAKAAGLG